MRSQYIKHAYLFLIYNSDTNMKYITINMKHYIKIFGTTVTSYNLGRNARTI